jgi:hypothetical protein
MKYSSTTCGILLVITQVAFSFMNVLPGLQQPRYEIASADLSRKWMDLVRDGQVAAKITVPRESGDISVTYGVELVEEKQCRDFIESDDPLIQQMSSKLGLSYAVDGEFAAQLQLVRTLRPPPSPGFSGSTSSAPPPYDSATDSFVTGPLRLELRPLVATLSLEGLVTPWDVFHNVSPADTRGHFLLLPTLSETCNWRGQAVTKQDCNDVVRLASSIQPAGSLLLGFNSVGAGASQNHIHVHAWPNPPLPLAQAEGQYPICSVTTIHDFCDIGDAVEVSFIEYPVFCVQLSAGLEHLDSLSNALATTLECLDESPYNIGVLNRIEEEQDKVDVFVFCRSKEQSSLVPSLKLGISEMMGLFHAQSEDELEHLTNDKIMERALEDVSVQLDLSVLLDEQELWIRIKDKLMSL